MRDIDLLMERHIKILSSQPKKKDPEPLGYVRTPNEILNDIRRVEKQLQNENITWIEKGKKQEKLSQLRVELEFATEEPQRYTGIKFRNYSKSK